jgi:hypothetical protein
MAGQCWTVRGYWLDSARQCVATGWTVLDSAWLWLDSAGQCVATGLKV